MGLSISKVPSISIGQNGEEENGVQKYALPLEFPPCISPKRKYFH